MKEEIMLFYQVCLCLGFVAGLGAVCCVQTQGGGPMK
jgi:hypothetical protein